LLLVVLLVSISIYNRHTITVRLVIPGRGLSVDAPWSSRFFLRRRPIASQHKEQKCYEAWCTAPHEQWRPRNG